MEDGRKGEREGKKRKGGKRKRVSNGGVMCMKGGRERGMRSV